jgi:Skp family chaperone for outer membrane proteins
MAEHKGPSHGDGSRYQPNESADSVIMLLRSLKSKDLERIERGISVMSASDADGNVIKERIGQIQNKRSCALHEAEQALEDTLRKGGDWRHLSKRLNASTAQEGLLDDTPKKSITRADDVAGNMASLMRGQGARRLRSRPGSSSGSTGQDNDIALDTGVSENTPSTTSVDTIVAIPPAKKVVNEQEPSHGRAYPKPEISIPAASPSAFGNSENPFIASTPRKKAAERNKASLTNKKPDEATKASVDLRADIQKPEKASPLNSMSLEDLEALEVQLKALNKSKLDKMIEDQNKLLEQKEKKRRAEEILERRKLEEAKRVAEKVHANSDVRESTDGTRARTGVGLPKTPPPSSDALKLAESFGLDISGLAAEIQQRHGHRTRSGADVTVHHKKNRRGSW